MDTTQGPVKIRTYDGRRFRLFQLKIYTYKNEKNIFIGFENLKTIKSIIYQHLPIDTDIKYQFSMCNS